MRIGAALEALDFILSDMPSRDRRERLFAYGTAQAIAERLRGISKAHGMSTSIINAQLLKIQFSAEAIAGLGGGRPGEESHIADIRVALEALAGPDCFGYQLDAIE